MPSLQEAFLAKGLVRELPKVESYDTYFDRVVPVVPGEEGVVCLDARISDIPEGVQIHTPSGGSGGVQPQQASSRQRLAWGKLDLESFLKCASVISINVVSDGNKFCRVYINHEVDDTRPGFNAWAGSAYEELVRKLASHVYEVCIVYWGPVKTRVVLTGNRSLKRTPDNEISFSAGKK